VVPAAAVALDWSSAPGPALAPSVGETAALQLAPVAPPVPAPIYRIQVRARESWAGADKLLAYLKGFGFRETLREEDGSRGGETLYTVFVGNYSTLKEARRECGRLIERTHKTPYKDKPDYFQDCFALRRPR
jgi:hypothetical protein